MRDGALSKAGSVPVNLGPGLFLRCAEKSCKLGKDPSSVGMEPESKQSDKTAMGCVSTRFEVYLDASPMASNTYRDC